MHIWLIHKDEIIRGGKLWRRDAILITDRPFYLLQFDKYELKDELGILKIPANNDRRGGI